MTPPDEDGLYDSAEIGLAVTEAAPPRLVDLQPGTYSPTVMFNHGARRAGKR